MIVASPRIEKLRAHALAARPAGGGGAEWEYNGYKGWLDSCRDGRSLTMRWGMTKRYVLSHADAVIDDGELLVGKYAARVLTPDEEAELALLRRYVAPAMPAHEGQGSHMAVDYEKLLRLGSSGVAREIRDHMEKTDPASPKGMEKLGFYEGCLAALQGLETLSDRYAAEALRQAETAPEPRRSELLRIAEICARVPKYPAATFYEALQAVHFLSFCMTGLYQAGRPDRYLIGYYRDDIQNGRVTPEFAQELLDCFALLYNEYIPGSLAVGYMVGGRGADGVTVCNEITRMCLQSIGHTRMIYPGIGLCLTDDMPEDVISLSLQLLREGYSHPALFNDEVIIRGLMHYGLPYEEACHYIHSTCVEITPCTCSAVWVASPYTNLPGLLLAEMRTAEHPSYEALKEAYTRRLSAHIAVNAAEQNRQQSNRNHTCADPLVSSFVNDCLARGLDVDQGGARHNFIMPSFVGVANLCDSLLAIRELVYESHELTLRQFAEILERNFEGEEALRQRILNKLPKYGNDNDDADLLVREITETIDREVARHTTYHGDRFIPSLFCWVMHERFGSETGATPDGRQKGFPLGDGSGPAQGREMFGPTASILSSTKWDHYPFIGGIAVNLRLSSRTVSDNTALRGLVDTFMKRGGFELQVNTVDARTLEEARKNPENYADLVVRIGGYSDFFVRLPAQMQQEVILRTAHDL